jgi:CRP/FNR family transcriptional regulator, cyclic AMP receptor protein
MAKDASDEVLDALKAIPMFSACDRKELQAIARLGTQLTISQGVEVTHQGNHGAELIIVLTGTARCLVDGAEVAKFGPGDFFGEMSLLDNRPRSATVMADSPLDALVFDPREFRSLVEASPTIAWKMLGVMATRLRDADNSIKH